MSSIHGKINDQNITLLISTAVICVPALCHVPRRVIVDCLAYPYTVFCRQCQVFPYNAATVSLSAPFSTTVVLHHIAQTQVRVALDGSLCTILVSKN